MSKARDLTVPQLYDAIESARGCGCCASYDDLPDDCPADEDGWVDHSYDGDCTRNFSGLLRLLANAARREVSA